MNAKPKRKKAIAKSNKGDVTMSTPTPPYYHKTGGDTYHWEKSCSKNHYPAQGWEKTNNKPNKEQCNECKAK
jgi:hypothetical protein